MNESIIEGQQYTPSIHDGQLLSIDENEKYQYHSNIHRDEELYQDEIMEKYLITPQIIKSIPMPEMSLSANFNRLTSFAISQIDSSNVKYYTALFKKLAEEATQSNHQLIFSGLQEISDHVVIYSGVQNEILDLLHSVQTNSVPNFHQQIIKITV